jgi:hypothetical protein
MTDSDNAYACDVCGGPTVPQAFSAGREYWCDACDTSFLYRLEDAPGPYALSLSEDKERFMATRKQLEEDVAAHATQRLEPFGVLALAPVRAYHNTDNMVEAVITLPAHELADIFMDAKAISDEWEALAGEWEARARKALEGMRAANDALYAWKARAEDAEAKLRILTTTRDDNDTEEE